MKRQDSGTKDLQDNQKVNAVIRTPLTNTSKFEEALLEAIRDPNIKHIVISSEISKEIEQHTTEVLFNKDTVTKIMDLTGHSNNEECSKEFY